MENPTKEARQEYPTSWLMLVKNDSVGYIIDALLDLPGEREFHQSELAEMAGVSRNSVGKHIDLLTALEIVEPVEGTSPTRYRFNPESDVSRSLIELEGAINRTVQPIPEEQPA
jgi:DNA-binding transcriptional regulator GbsR (MarR family)